MWKSFIIMWVLLGNISFVLAEENYFSNEDYERAQDRLDNKQKDSSSIQIKELQKKINDLTKENQKLKDDLKSANDFTNLMGHSIISIAKKAPDLETKRSLMMYGLFATKEIIPNNSTNTITIYRKNWNNHSEQDKYILVKSLADFWQFNQNKPIQIIDENNYLLDKIILNSH